LSSQVNEKELQYDSSIHMLDATGPCTIAVYTKAGHTVDRIEIANELEPPRSPKQVLPVFALFESRIDFTYNIILSYRKKDAEL
jgi:hypothetical protein